MPRDAEHLKCGFTAPSVDLFRGHTGNQVFAPIEAGMGLVMRANGKVSVIRTIKDLRGHVRIKSPEDALQFVRLTTSLETGFLFEHDEWVEIVPSSLAATIPTFGLHGHGVLLMRIGMKPGSTAFDAWSYDPDRKMYEHVIGTLANSKTTEHSKSPDLSEYGVGIFGFLADKLFRGGHLTSPNCTRQGSDFVVDRWNRVHSQTHDIEHILERVSPDGTYVKTVLETRDLESVPGGMIMGQVFM
jgi:hypothetical protein